MKRLLVYVDTDDITNIINTHLKYENNMLRDNTKKFISTSGTFCLTKFNPDVDLFENYIQHPFITIKKLTKRNKQKLQYLALAASGLKLEKDKDFYKILEGDKLVGLSFVPLEDEVIEELLKEIE